MCLSTIYYADDKKHEEPLAEDVTEVRIRDGCLVFTDLIGADTEIAGDIECIDFVRSYITVRRPEGTA
ncbi:MAG: CooT family nickel-binding protein [Actinomycetia bacterium]|nr:CooT family nickel-binding protein [Actinomycetes bacterium]